ncbi:MAG: hypothetical protein KKC18_07595 [Chloroflexi bacterium]|nr:hypothetical protein [Chloroflexota bacterium]
MIGITAQESLYPLPQEAIAPEIGEALQVFRECAVEVVMVVTLSNACPARAGNWRSLEF